MLTTPQNLLLATLLGFLSSLYGSIVGGAGIISIPGLIFLGLPPETAIATNKLADLGRFTAATYLCSREKRICWSYVRSLLPLAVCAGALGAHILAFIAPARLQAVLGYALILALGFSSMRPRTYSDSVPLTPRRWAFGHLLYFLCSLYASALQVGSGPLLLTILMTFFGLRILEANATSSVCWLFLSFSAVCVFSFRGSIAYPPGVALMLGSLVGGHLGTRMSHLKGEEWTRRAFLFCNLLIAFSLLIRP